VLKVYDVAGRAPREGGETVLGLEDLGTHACYMLYGVLNPGEEPRILKPGEGHEEIILAVSGAIQVSGPQGSLTLQPGQAIYLQGAATYEAVALGPGEARYVAAGGHTPGQHHHH
jgi:hypothetical protein